MTLPIITNDLARRLFLHRHLLSDAPTGEGKGADLKAVIDTLGFVQLDSVNTFARAHDMILWSRRQQYRPPALGHLLHRDRQVFEHWTHDASVIPVQFFPHWQHRFTRDRERLAARWVNWHSGDFLHQVDQVRDRIAATGACTSGDVGEGEARTPGGWWNWHPSKVAIEYLWRTGEVSVVRRDGFTKVYDLTERVIPAQHLNARPHSAASIDWACSQALDRLGFATSGELSAFWDLATPDEAKAWCVQALTRGDIIEVLVQGIDGSLRKSFARPDVMEAAAPEPTNRLRILSPFDPALRDRKRAERLFGFSYRIEIFVPSPKRTYGYYVFPVMDGGRMIGRIDMKREGETLMVTAFWPEQGVRWGKGLQARLDAELARAARFGGCNRIDFAPAWLTNGTLG